MGIMIGVNFPEAQQFLGRPDGMTQDECGALPVCRGVYAGQYPVVISCFEPTEEERAAIAAGANVYLHVVGATMPPVILSTSIETPVLPGKN